MSAPNLDGYVDVPTRHALALAAHPELRIVESEPVLVRSGEAEWVSVTMRVYRSPDDLMPAVGTAWERIPGLTAFTRNSEMMNAATSALGRALGYMGFGSTRSLASSEEVENRRREQDWYTEPDPAGPITRPVTGTRAKGDGPNLSGASPASAAQLNMIRALQRSLGGEPVDVGPITKAAASELITELKAEQAEKDRPR